MENKVLMELSSELLQSLQEERIVLLGTVDNETSGTNVNALSWVFAINAKTINFAIDWRSRLLENIKKNNLVTLTFFALGTIYTITGRADIVEEKINNVSINLAKVQIKIESIHNVMFYGGKVTEEPKYEKTYNQELAKKLDNEVITALSKE